MKRESKCWRQALLNSDASLLEAITKLNDAALKIVIVCDESGRLVGTVSDGDIRRGLLRGLTGQSPVAEVVRHKPLVVPEGVSRELALQLMIANKLHQIPVVNEALEPVGLHLWDDLAAPAERKNLMVLMAGGFGTRLRPFTESCPKPMLLVAGKPMLEHVIVRAANEGFQNFVIAIHYLGHVIEEYFGDGRRWNVNITYLKEVEPLGTAGALSLLESRPSQPIVVANGDVMSDIRYGELLDFHLRHCAIATMAVRQHEWQHPYGVVNMRGLNIVGFEEKPVSRTHINAGVYALSPEALGYLSSDERCDMPDLFERIRVNNLPIVAYPMHEPWLDVGRPDDLAKANLNVGG